MKRPTLNMGAARLRPAALKPLPYMAARAPNPMAGAKAKTVEDSGAEIMANMTAGYRAQEKQQKAAYAARNSTGYYRVVVFQDDAQAETFARAAGMDPEPMFLDGRVVARNLGIDLPAPGPIKPKKAHTDTRLAALAREQK